MQRKKKERKIYLRKGYKQEDIHFLVKTKRAKKERKNERKK